MGEAKSFTLFLLFIALMFAFGCIEQKERIGFSQDEYPVGSKMNLKCLLSKSEENCFCSTDQTMLFSVQIENCNDLKEGKWYSLEGTVKDYKYGIPSSFYFLKGYFIAKGDIQGANNLDNIEISIPVIRAENIREIPPIEIALKGKPEFYKKERLTLNLDCSEANYAEKVPLYYVNSKKEGFYKKAYFHLFPDMNDSSSFNETREVELEVAIGKCPYVKENIGKCIVISIPPNSEEYISNYDSFVDIDGELFSCFDESSNTLSCPFRGEAKNVRFHIIIVNKDKNLGCLTNVSLNIT